jgi:uncharacterized protein YdaU (DUF1376 family)
MALVKVQFDINETVAQMLAGIKETVEENWPEVKSTLSQFFERRKDRLALLAELRIAKDITEEQFKSRLEDEKDVLAAEMHAIAVITKAIAQKAANTAIDILIKAVKAIVTIPV